MGIAEPTVKTLWFEGWTSRNLGWARTSIRTGDVWYPPDIEAET